MAIKIQRAWRKYKTKKIIESLLNPSIKEQNTSNSGFNNILAKLDQSPIVTEKSQS